MSRKKNIVVEPDADLDDEVVIVDGERLTEADADAWSDEIARDRYWDNLIPGRKSLSGGSIHSPALNLRVSVETRRRLSELAAQRGTSVSRVAREAIEKFLAND